MPNVMTALPNIGCIKMPLGTDVGLSPGDCVRPRPSPPPHKGGGAPSPIFGPFLLWSNGWMHQYATWYGGRPQPRGFGLHGDPAPLPTGRRRLGESPQFSAHGYCGRAAELIMTLGVEVGLGAVHIVLDGNSSKQGAEPPNFRPVFIVAKRLDASGCQLVRR